MDPSPVHVLLPRQSQSSTDTFLGLIADPFQSQIQSDAFFASLATSLGITVVITLLFCLLRPYNTVVYAPRTKYADEKHAPPQVGKGAFAWIQPLISTKEEQIIDKLGLDAALFLRFTSMCRNIFLVLTVIGCGVLIPVNIIGGSRMRSGNSGITTFMKMTPQYMYGSSAFWAFVVCAYVFDAVIMYFLWSNYRAVTRLRRACFESPEYQASLHARTLLITDIPKASRTDEGLVHITDEVKSLNETPTAAIARNMKDLPDLVEEHETTVRDLEGYLAKYLRDPNKLPAQRPTCKPSKEDASYRKGQKVDAIDYLTSRIRELEVEIKEVRGIENAHTLAHAAKNKHPQGTTIVLAPKPQDLIWKNLPLAKKQRRWGRFINNVWFVVLTVAWIAPNALSAVFLSNLGHLGQVWPAFQTQLRKNPTWWAIVQGVVSPAVTSLFYFYLPAVFRRLSIRSGDLSKTSRERHVMHKLYAFFVFNNLFVFSLFAAVWGYITAVTNLRQKNTSVWDAIKQGNIFNQVMLTLCSVTPFWITWLLQRNLGAAVDLVQVFNLAWGSFSRKFLSPTPRQLIELSAPQPFEYASYYNYFLFYATVALCFTTLQPLVIPVTAFYFWLDTYLKKYLLLYVFITKIESGGQFWRVLYNRFIFAALLGNAVIALVVAAQGSSLSMLGAMAPLPVILFGFKMYCSRVFDDKIHYYTKGAIIDVENTSGPDEKTLRGNRLGVRFGHPVLYRPLMTPMVHAKSQHLLKEVYGGRLDGDTDGASIAGYSDISMDAMSRTQAGKPAGGNPAAPFEIVSEARMDFEYYKNRPEFREQYGGDGEMYGRPADLIRPGTPASFVTQDCHPNNSTRSSSRDSEATRIGHGEDGTSYPTGYQKAPLALREQSPDARGFDVGTQRAHQYQYDNRGALLGGAAAMGSSPPVQGERGYGPLLLETPDVEDTSYDYFRRGRGL
ncbi:putative DUF221 domain protein [Cryomyces antarcticus]